MICSSQTSPLRFSRQRQAKTCCSDRYSGRLPGRGLLSLMCSQESQLVCWGAACLLGGAGGPVSTAPLAGAALCSESACIALVFSLIRQGSLSPLSQGSREAQKSLCKTRHGEADCGDGGPASPRAELGGSRASQCEQQRPERGARGHAAAAAAAYRRCRRPSLQPPQPPPFTCRWWTWRCASRCPAWTCLKTS